MQKSNSKIQERIGVKGEITTYAYDQKTLIFLERLWNRLVITIGLDKVRWYILGELKWIDKRTNVICDVGFLAHIKRLHGDTTYDGEINYMALGTGAPTPAISDTKLDTETYRNTTASGTSAANVVYLTAYYTESEVDGTFTEFGNFIDGIGSADSGQLWSHIAGFSWVKDSSTVLVVDCKYTFVSA